MASVRSSFGELLLRPQRFFVSKPFALIYMLYSSTYLTANTIDTLSATTTNQTSLTTTTGPLKFLGTSTVNMSLCLYKDSQFARLFGPPNSIPRAVPAASYALFAFRDSLTIFASFNVPPLLAPHMPVSEAFERSVLSRASAAQFVAPAAMQLVSTPLHLLGLDLYNRGEKAVGWGSRWQKVRKDWLKSSAARMCRIVPAFGVGGVVNLRVREGVMRRLGCS
ncbi:MAG: hypothetical protein M1817_006172 [Caeruleum heppii]|nr:MAG: hypothetical protein M1817_006172 [Caeruleum heppii]